MRTKPLLIVIVGPTASGKSELAVKIAKRIGGEIISADSRQIYQKLNLGAGKIKGVWKKGLFIYKKIPHYCIDEAPLSTTYTVADYKKCADAAINAIQSKGKIPIIAGGTGFWIDAVLYDFALPPVPPNNRLRKKLARKNPAQLLALLQKKDPKRAASIEQKNPRRLVRALEIAHALGHVPKLKKHNHFHAQWFGIHPLPNDLRKKIRRRLRQRLREGMIDEARRLKKTGIPWKRFYELGLEYRFLAEYLRGKITRKEMFLELEQAIEEYARRQNTWFKKNPRITWVSNPKKALRIIAARKNF